MEASPMSLFEKFIKEAYGSQYVIPVYQRNYTWKKNKQVRQLLDDVERILKGEAKKHFIGTIVYNIVKTDFMVREREVVDGQQRLITMFLIAYALRNIARTQGEDDIAQAITSNYLENNSSDKYKYRLQPSVSDDDAYSYIAKDIISDYEGNSLVMDNYKYLYSRLEAFTKNYSLMSVINAVREIYIVRIELDTGDDAQQIFESINSTGEKLTAADLIRNFIMMRRTNEEQESIYENYWLKLEKIFPESKKLAEFIRFYLASKKHSLTTERDLYPVFKDYWKACDGENEYLNILGDILHYAQHFERLYLSNKKEDPLGEELLDFRRLQSFMPAPFSMKLLEHLRVGEITQEQAKHTLKILNTYLIRRYISGQDTSAISRFFPGYLKNVEEQVEANGSFDKYVDICIYFLVNDNRANSKFMPDDIQLKNYLETANAYTLSNIRWVLDKIESYNNPAPADLSKLNIEHVMPQTPNEYWTKVSGLDEDEYTKVVNRLGNLTLAASSDNSKMGNKNFEEKKKILGTTNHLNLNAEILLKDEWTVDDIDDRGKSLVDKIIEIFPYEKCAYEVVGKDSTRYITLEAKGIVAMGYLNMDESLTVYADSQVYFNTKPSSDSLKELREDFLEKEIIIEKDGTYAFAQSYTFSSPSSATDFILGGSNNGWNYWKDSNGQVINDSLRHQSISENLES